VRPDRAHQAVDGRHPGLTGRAGAAVAALAILAGTCSATAQRLAGTSLTIEVRASEGAAPTGYTLACDPAGGTLPGAAEACDRLAASGAPFARLPADAVCTQVYGGPEVATVRGVFRGQAVDAVFTRRNGCEIARYDRLLRLLGLKPTGRT
jgi:hypothetical protein